MISFKLNGNKKTFNGDETLTLLKYLREHEGITSPKDGCSGQSACGACMVEIDGKAKLSCVTKMGKLNGAEIITIEGFPEDLRQTLGRAFVEKGAVQCGFCTPGFLMRTKVLLENNPNPTREEIIDALKFNICRCTGYIKIIEAIEMAANALNEKKIIELSKPGKVGLRHAKYDAYEKAIGASPFVDDLKFDGMLHGALKFTDHPRAKINKIDISEAQKIKGVERIFTSADIPGEQYYGLIYNDWPLMVSEGETTRYIGDVLAGVVAINEDIAREAVEMIKVDYEIYDPISDPFKALETSEKIHEKGNLLDVCAFKRGDNIDEVVKKSAHIVKGTFETQRIEHAFMETETAISVPLENNKVELFVQSQGVYEDQRQVSQILGIPIEDVIVNLVPNGGGFGGKEDMTVQGHAALFCYYLRKPVKVHLTRDESIMMHPKRHPIFMDYIVACDEKGKLTAVKARIVGDTGAYASVGTKVLERSAGHVTGGYHVPNVDVEAKTVYTNNIPCGAMRGFGVNQVTFAVESCIDDLCKAGNFDRWQFRYDNALVNGSMTATGQILKKGVGVRECLNALKDDYGKAKFSGIACGIKNTGIGNGMPDDSVVKIEIRKKDHVVLHHGWTEMGQGINTIALQTLCTETGIDPEIVEVVVSTKYSARSGMTTASRGTSLVGNAILDATQKIKKDLDEKNLEELVGNIYEGYWVCDFTTKPGDPGDVITHYSYGYAAQLVVLDDSGKVEKVVAAHDAGKIMNPTLFESQIQGSVHMGLGYALSEELPMLKSKLKSSKFRDLGIMKIKDVPEIIVKGIEVKDPYGPYGAKGVGEIGLVPTAAAVANALCQFDGKRRYKLPIKEKK